MTPKRNSALPLLAAVLLPLLVTGCSTGSLLSSPGRIVRDPGLLIGRPRYEKNIGRIVTLWEPSQGKDQQGKNARGFAGQILFFGPTGQTGSRVRGKVLISVFDNYDVDSEAEPTLLHRFEFDEDAWEAHRGEGTLGHSYSVFIPYTNNHRNQVNCALRVELVQENGHTVSSMETEVLLPGKNTVQAAASRTRGFVRESRIEPHSKITPASATTEESPLDTISIPLPKR